MMHEYARIYTLLAISIAGAILIPWPAGVIPLVVAGYCSYWLARRHMEHDPSTKGDQDA